VQTFEGQW
jgi:vitamin B12 transporter